MTIPGRSELSPVIRLAGIIVPALSVQGDGRNGSRSLPAAYVREHVELAYATTVHGAQGETTHTGHLLLGEHTTAAATYVAMTRGREDNVAHLVAENLDDALPLLRQPRRLLGVALPKPESERALLRSAER